MNIKGRKAALGLVYGCFFLSGTASLIYEVVWARQLGLFLGITVHAHIAVITAYMFGLAAGSFWFGRISDRLFRPLQFYAWLEICIGLYAALTPWLIDVLQLTYINWTGMDGVTSSSAHLIRFSIALAALLVPTFLMGGTLPLLVKGVTQSLPQLASTTGRLYGINTLGATLGTAIAGFVLLPAFGMTHTIFVGAAINLGIALLILTFLRAPLTGTNSPEVTQEASRTEELDQPTRIILLWGFGAAGFAALLIQLAWIRTMILVVGGSVYAFTVTLTAFLAGIGLGSLCYAHCLTAHDSVRRRLQLAAILSFAIALFTLIGLPLIAKLPALFVAAYAKGWVQDFGIFQMLTFGMSFIIMFLPTMLMGALFPLLAVTWTNSFAFTGKGIGTAYAVNTAGTILGSILGGLCILPWLGTRNAILGAVIIYALIAGGFWVIGGKRNPLMFLACSIILLGIALMMPPWDRAMMTAGVYDFPERFTNAIDKGKNLSEIVNAQQILYYKEGRVATVAVTTDGEEKNLLINGKNDATSVLDLTTQVALGQLPALLHPQPKNALVIGLGSGITASALATHSSIDEITILEISDEVIEASEFFADENRNVLDDPRVQVIPADARNFILAANRQWDIIVSEPSNPWLSGVSNLFTDDFFRQLKKRLAPGGVMAQWIHLYGISTMDVKSILRTFAENYRYVSIWHVQSGDLVMVGSDTPRSLSYQRLKQAFSDPLIGPDLRRAKFESPKTLVLDFLLSRQDVLDYAGDVHLNTDDRPSVEFNAPRSMYKIRSIDNLTDIISNTDGEYHDAPVNETYNMTDQSINMNFMNLELNRMFSDQPEISNAAWRVLYQVEEDGDNLSLSLSSYRIASWREGNVALVIQMTHSDQVLETEQRRQQLLSRLSYSLSSEGELSIAGDSKGQWLIAVDENKQILELILGWTCPGESGGINWYIMKSNQPYPTDNADFLEAEKKAITQMAARPLCS